MSVSSESAQVFQKLLFRYLRGFPLTNSSILNLGLGLEISAHGLALPSVTLALTSSLLASLTTLKTYIACSGKTICVAVSDKCQLCLTPVANYRHHPTRSHML